METNKKHKPSPAAQAIYEMSKLRVSQKDGAVRTGTGEVVGRQKWVVNVDYSLDTIEGEDFVVNAASKEEAEENRFDTRPFLGLPAWFKGFKIENTEELVKEN